MKRSELTPDDLVAEMHDAVSVAGAQHRPIRVAVDGVLTEAKVVRATANGLGVTLWAES